MDPRAPTGGTQAVGERFGFNLITLVLWWAGFVVIVFAAFVWIFSFASTTAWLLSIPLWVACAWLGWYVAMLPFHSVVVSPTAITARLSRPVRPRLRSRTIPWESVVSLRMDTSRTLLYGILPVWVSHSYHVYFSAFDPALQRQGLFAVSFGDSIWRVATLFNRVHQRTFDQILSRRALNIDNTGRSSFGPLELSADGLFWPKGHAPLQFGTHAVVDRGQLTVSWEEGNRPRQRSWAVNSLNDPFVLVAMVNSLSRP